MAISERQVLDIIRVLSALILLAIAAKSDWKTRTAENWIWAILALVGIACLGSQMYIDSWETVSYAGLALICLVFVDMFWERKPLYDREAKRVNWIALVILLVGIILLAYLLVSDISWTHKTILLGVVGMVYLMYVFYIINIIHGGADAKALMVLAMVFPIYPRIFSLPMVETIEILELTFPFAFLILFNSALATLAVPIALLLYNIRKGDVHLPQSLLGYKKSIAEDPSFAWPMEKVEEDKIKMVYFPRKGTDSAQAFQDLRDAGKEEAWVTPKIPFLIPMLVGLIISIIVGNILWAFFS